MREGENHLPFPAGETSFHADQDMVGFGAESIHCHPTLSFHQLTPQSHVFINHIPPTTVAFTPTITTLPLPEISPEETLLEHQGLSF